MSDFDPSELNHIRNGRKPDAALCGYPYASPQERKGAYCNECVKALAKKLAPQPIWPWRRKTRGA